MDRGLPTDDPAFRFTYKLTYTYCVQTTGPLVGGQLVENIMETEAVSDDGFQTALEEYLMDEAGVRSHVYLANIYGEATENTNWSLF